MAKEKKAKAKEKNNLIDMDTLTKLRLVVSSIFVLITLAIIIAFALRKQVFIAFGIALIGYLMIFGLMVKLLLAKKL